MPMIPQAAIAMLACARLGAMHSVVFGGFSADSLLSRIQDADACLVITADGGYRKGSPLALKTAVDEALKSNCLLYTSPSPRDRQKSRMPSSA